MAKRPKAELGDVFEVHLGDGHFAFGVVAAGNDHAFFDLRSQHPPSLEQIVSKRVIFRVPVAQDVFSSGRWKILGNVTLKGALSEPAAYRNQPIGSNEVFLYRSGRFTPATVAEVRDLEPLAVWFDQHIVSRLNNYFAKQPNQMAEQLKTIKQYDPVTGQEIKPPLGSSQTE